MSRSRRAARWPSPAAEAQIAAAGPLTSLLLGVVFVGLALLVGTGHPARASIPGVMVTALAGVITPSDIARMMDRLSAAQLSSRPRQAEQLARAEGPARPSRGRAPTAGSSPSARSPPPISSGYVTVNHAGLNMPALLSIAWLPRALDNVTVITDD